jgi:Ser/Thr protein kinase RdoA (MazF antagonist)
LFRFVRGSHTIDVVSSPEQAFEASLQFGKFTRLLSGFRANDLHITIPDFHNLTLRYKQFEDAVQYGNLARVKQAGTLISSIKKHVHILNEYETIQKNTYAKQRVTHHDTKISNVLFDDQGKGMCVIDLDTVMPGYFISDVGDMLRTYLSPANEEEKDFDKIEVRDEFFQAIVQGYLVNMGDELTSEEKGLLLYAGMFLIYMQAIRFLADFCNNDIYYGARYEDHNLVRAGNQIELLRRLDEKQEKLLAIVAAELKTGNYVKS